LLGELCAELDDLLRNQVQPVVEAKLRAKIFAPSPTNE
jgi:hypothetical protein